MKSLKKIGLLVSLAILMCLSFLMIGLSNRAVKAEEEALTIIVSDEIVKPGDSVDIDLALKNNPGVVSIKIKVNYGENLTLTNVVFNSNMGGQTSTSNYAVKGGPVTLSWVNAFNDYTDNSTFATLTFNVLENVEVDTYDEITITYNEDDIYNSRDNNVEVEIVNGVVYYSNAIAGDINGDGKVNNKDITRLFQYLANWEVEVNKLALDVNGDEKVNNKDITRLFQYLANWDVKLYLTLTEVDIQKGSEGAETIYVITFDCDGGTKIESINVKYDEEITLPTPKKDDYTFVKWVIKGTSTVVSNGAWKYKQNVVLKAIWKSDFTKFY